MANLSSLLSDLIGLCGLALAITTLCACALNHFRLPQKSLLLICSVTFLFILTPLGQDSLSIAAYMRGMVGDLSVTTLVLLVTTLYQRLCATKLPQPRRLITLAIVIAGASVLYPMALGWGLYDPYRWGYGSPVFLLSLFLLALAARYWRLPLLTLAISLAVLLWAAGAYESSNLWDYLLDPLLVFYALGVLIFTGLKTAKHTVLGSARTL